MRSLKLLKFGFFKKKESTNKILCSSCRRDLSEGKSDKTIVWCDKEDPKQPVYSFHPECVRDGIDIGEAVSTKTVKDKGWIPQPF